VYDTVQSLIYNLPLREKLSPQYLSFLKNYPSKIFDPELTNLVFNYSPVLDKDITQRRAAAWGKSQKGEYDRQEQARIAAEKEAYAKQREEDKKREAEARQKALSSDGDDRWSHIFDSNVNKFVSPAYKRDVYNPRFYNPHDTSIPNSDDATKPAPNTDFTEGQTPPMRKKDSDEYLKTLRRELLKEPSLDFNKLPSFQPFNPEAYPIGATRDKEFQHHKDYQENRQKQISDELNLIDRIRGLNYAAHAFNKGMNKESGQEMFERILKQQLGKTGEFMNEYEKKYKKAKYAEEKAEGTKLGAHDFYNVFRGATAPTPNGKPTLGAILETINAANKAIAAGPF
jgi:hypothetical protein